LPSPPRPGGSPFRRKERDDERAKERGEIAGLVLYILIGGLLIFTGSQKVFGSVPPEALVKYGLGEQMRLLGAGQSSAPSSC
jgi:hypothetical protein